jgi:hypothetical protein
VNDKERGSQIVQSPNASTIFRLSVRRYEHTCRAAGLSPGFGCHHVLKRLPNIDIGPEVRSGRSAGFIPLLISRQIL